MATPIKNLTEATDLTDSDLLLIEQAGLAKKITGKTLKAKLAKLAAGHGSITGIAKVSSSGNIDVYRISYTDGNHFDFSVTNGRLEVKTVNGKAPNATGNINIGSTDVYATSGKTLQEEIDSLKRTSTSERGFILLGDSNASIYNQDGTTLVPWNPTKYCYLSAMKDYIDEKDGYSCLAYIGFPGIGFTSGAVTYLSKFSTIVPSGTLNPNVTDIVICGLGNDTGKPYAEVVNAMATFLSEVHARCFNLRRIYMFWHASCLTIGRNKKATVLAAWDEAARLAQDGFRSSTKTEFILKDLSRYAADVSKTMSYDNNHYNKYGHEQMVTAAINTIENKPYDRPLPVVFQNRTYDAQGQPYGELPEQLGDIRLSPTSNSEIIWYPSGAVSINLALRAGTYNNNMKLTIPTIYYRAHNLGTDTIGYKRYVGMFGGTVKQVLFNITDVSSNRESTTFNINMDIPITFSGDAARMIIYIPPLMD